MMQTIFEQFRKGGSFKTIIIFFLYFQNNKCVEKIWGGGCLKIIDFILRV